MENPEPTADELMARRAEIRRAQGLDHPSTSTSSNVVPLRRAAEPAIADADEPCPRCRKNPARTIPGAFRALPCGPCADRLEEMRSGRVKDTTERRAAGIRGLLEDMGVNVRRYGTVTLDSFDPVPDRPALEAARRFLDEFRSGLRPSLYLFGRRKDEPLAAGNGKTHLAVAILRELALDPAVPPSSLRFVFVPELLLQIQDTFDSPERRTLDVVRSFETPELLVWDDMGAEKMSEFAVRTLYTILYKREGRSNVFTSNLTLDQLIKRDAFAERITSRIAGDAEVVEMSGPDRRPMR